MRVFELARDLNVPGKDLIDRIRALGYTVENNFNVLDEKTVKAIKEKLLEPVSRVEDAKPAEEESDAETPTRKRRIISASRSKSTHRIQESLGESGPLPEDQATREEVSSETEEPLTELTTEPSISEPTGEAEGTEPSEVVAEPEETEKIEMVPEPIPDPLPVILETKIGAATPKSKERPHPRKEIIPEDEERISKKPGDPDRTNWRDAKRERRHAAAPAPTADEWVRPVRRKRVRPTRKVRKDVEQKHVFGPRKRAVRLGNSATVSELAGALGVKANDIIRKLMTMEIMVTINDVIDGTTIALIAESYDISVEVDTSTLEDIAKEQEIQPKDLQTRPPIVTIMGHVDHGKTSLLDYIRSSRITAREAGGITQHIGAYHVPTDNGDVVFLDTPGHEAFTSLRARGADVTDLVILVVAADDGVMPQTVEAIDHARAAEVPIIVAINKIDRPNANLDRIKTQLMEYQLLAEEFGGETIIVPVSAHTGEGVDQLLEMIHLQSEMMELQTTYGGHARGFVIESQRDRTRGAVATVIIQRGTLHIGDDFLAGMTTGRVRAMFNDRGEAVETVTPSLPVEILGYNDLPMAGDEFVVLEDERAARQIAEQREEKQREAEVSERRRLHLEDFLQSGPGEEVTVLPLVIKADAQGSLEALRGTLEKLGHDTARVEFVRAGVGGISETDVSLAATTNSVVIGFCVRADTNASEMARVEGVDIKTYTVIYDLINDMRDALQGLLKPIVREEVIGHCEIRDVFTISKEQIAGGHVNDGRLERNSMVRLYRDNVLIHSGLLSSLRRFKEDVNQVQSGYECGLRIANFNDIRVGDLIEAYVNVEEAATLDNASNS